MKHIIPTAKQSPMTPQFDLNEMAIFVKVVEAGSFIGAARALDIPKTTVSRKIAQLEETLGARLLQRTTRKVNLTEVGRAYYERCAKILGDIKEANLAVTTLQSVPYGTLRISTSVVVGTTLVNAWVTEFLDHYEQVNVEILLTNQYVDLVAQGIDVAFRAGPLGDSSLIAHKLGAIPYWLCASPKYLATYGEPQTPKDLIQHQCVNITSETLSELIQWTFSSGKEQAVVKVAGRILVNDFLFIKQVILNGYGIAYVPNIVVLDDVKTGRLVRLLTGWTLTERDIYMVYPSDRHLSPKVRAFLDFITDKVTPYPPWLN